MDPLEKFYYLQFYFFIISPFRHFAISCFKHAHPYFLWFCFTPSSVIGSKTSCHILILHIAQWIASWRHLHVFASISDWFIELYPSPRSCKIRLNSVGSVLIFEPNSGCVLEGIQTRNGCSSLLPFISFFWREFAHYSDNSKT